MGFSPQGGIERLRVLLPQLALRPAMYVGESDLKRVGAFLEGYTLALETAEGMEPSWSDFRCWLEGVYGISHPAWHWTDILLYHSGSHKEAIELMAEQFDLFLRRDRESDMAKWSEERIWATRGVRTYAPSDYDFASYPLVRQSS